MCVHVCLFVPVYVRVCVRVRVCCSHTPQSWTATFAILMRECLYLSVCTSVCVCVCVYVCVSVYMLSVSMHAQVSCASGCQVQGLCRPLLHTFGDFFWKRDVFLNLSFWLWVLCYLTGFAQLVSGRSKCSPSFLIQSHLCRAFYTIVYGSFTQLCRALLLLF